MMQQHLPEEIVALALLLPHNRNYRQHPQDQIDHLKASIEKHGMYRNVVVARDNTILAGHGVVEAARQMGFETIPVRRVDVAPESVHALAILTGDNEIDHLGIVDDRQLTELLKEIAETEPSALVGTGYDEMMLANLAFVTRPRSEIRDLDAAAEWVGLPAYDEEVPQEQCQLVITFGSDADRERFVTEHQLAIRTKRAAGAWSTVWPYQPHDDPASLLFTASSDD